MILQMHAGGTILQISGWGITESGSTSLDLLGNNVTMLSDSTCESLGNAQYNTESQLCIYNEETSACNGDSGGPVTTVTPSTGRHELVGLVSYGWTGCVGYNVYTRVSHYISWIDAIYPAATCF